MSNCTILVIDSSPASADTYQRLLQQDGLVAYQVLSEQGDGQLVTLCQSQPIDVILLESHFPNLEGFELLVQLQTQLGEDCPPIIVIDHNDANLAKRALKAGAVDYLVRDQITAATLTQTLWEVTALSTESTSPLLDPPLKANIANFRVVANLVQDLLWYNDPQGFTLWHNQRWLEYTGQTFEEACGYGWLEAIHPDDRDQSLANFQNAGDEQRSLVQEHRIRSVTGEYRWFLLRAEPLRDQENRVVRWFCVAKDIHDQRVNLEALRKREKQFRLFVTASSDIIYKMSADWREMRSLEGKNFLVNTDNPNPSWLETYIPPEEQPRVMAAIQDAIRTKSLFELEHRVIRQDGTLGWTFSRAIPLLNDQGDIVEWLGAASDVTDHKRAEEQLRRAAEIDTFRVKLSDALRSLSDSIEIQAQACRLLGENLGVDRAYYVEVNEAEGYARVNQDYLRGDSPSLAGTFPLAEYGWVVPYLRRGETLTVADTATAAIVPDTDREQMAAVNLRAHITLPITKAGALVGALCVTECVPREWSTSDIELVRETAERIWADIQRAHSEASLRESEAKYRSLFENINDGFCIMEMLYDNDGNPKDCRILETSPSFGEHNGLINAEGKTAKAFEPNLESEWLKKYNQVVVTGQTVRFEIYNAQYDTWFDVKAFPHKSPDEHQFAVVFSKINDRKQAEENRIRLLEEQAARQEEHQRAETLAELDQAKTRFFSNISHEFRTPLTLLLAPLEDALQDSTHSLPPPQRERLELAHRNSLRLLKLVNTLLDFSRVEAGRWQANYEPTDLASYTAQLASMFRSTIEKAGLQLIVDCPPLPEPVDIDRSMWEKIVLNLLSNAFKFTFRGAIAVSVQALDHQIELIVMDTGTGIPAAELPHIFERFYQSQEKRGRSLEGSGIGLSLVQELVKLQGGKIMVSSKVERGTTFRVTLPTGTAHLPPDCLPQREPRADIPTATVLQASAFSAESKRWLPEDRVAGQPLALALQNPDRKTGRILLVDDNADMRHYLQGLLNPYYEVETVQDGLTALGAIRESIHWDASPKPAYDLVLSDVMMPHLDGLELLRALRSDPHTRDIPIILLSARAGEESQIEGLDRGADDYLIKPFSAQELLARIGNLLELVQMRREATYREQVMEEIQRLNETLEYRVQTRTAQLAAINQELEAFSASVSHDLQTPLRYISSFAEQLQRKLNPTELDSTSRQYLDIITEAAKQSQQMVNNLLEFSRTGQTQLRLTQVPMNQLVQQARSRLEPDLAGRVVQWQLESLPNVPGDLEMLGLVIQNLLSNAVKYTRNRAQAQITMGSLDHNQEIVFFVKDNGVGFEMKYHDRLFNLFQRLHPSEQFAGTGVGLAHVRRIIHRHGGRIWAEGVVGEGATFYFALPKEEASG